MHRVPLVARQRVVGNRKLTPQVRPRPGTHFDDRSGLVSRYCLLLWANGFCSLVLDPQRKRLTEPILDSAFGRKMVESLKGLCTKSHVSPLLCAVSVFSVVDEFRAKTHHRDTEVAQRNQCVGTFVQSRLKVSSSGAPSGSSSVISTPDLVRSCSSPFVLRAFARGNSGRLRACR